MWGKIFLAVIGSCLGVVVGTGTLALIIALGIVVRYVRLTDTRHRIRLYEDCAFWGTLAGALWGLSELPVPLGIFGVIVYGFFSGFFLGSWSVAIGEVINVYAILFRRLKIEKAVGWVFFVMAVGKMIGTILFFRKGWW